MLIIFYVIVVTMLFLAIGSLVFGIMVMCKHQFTLPEVLRSFIRENRQTYGVCNHGTSMDDVPNIQVLSPNELGL